MGPARLYRRLLEQLPPAPTAMLVMPGSSVSSLRIGEAPVDLIGFSGGATSALAYASANPGRVRRLVLIEPSWLGNHMPAPEEVEYLNGLDAVMRLPDRNLGAAFIRHFNPYRHDAAAAPIPSTQLAHAAAGMRRVWRRWRQTHTEPDLGDLPIPLLICPHDRRHPARSTAARAPRGASCITAEHDHFTITTGVTLQVAGFLTDPHIA